MSINSRLDALEATAANTVRADEQSDTAAVLNTLSDDALATLSRELEQRTPPESYGVHGNGTAPTCGCSVCEHWRTYTGHGGGQQP